ncbi:MAG TPA: COX15/CtaA family protein [Nitrososphaeraceae archaeon]|nr:COX15/CtaA family protein [Nitrososphaeraceae archaeon]
MNYLRYLSFGTLSCLFALIFFGGYVSASGVGLSCPDWPLCPAGLVPMDEFLIEYTHRTLAATTGLLVILTMVFTLRSKLARRGMKLAALIAAGLVLGQIALGGVVIVEKLHALLVTIHFAIGMTLFSMLILVTVYTFHFPSTAAKKEITSTLDKS